MFLPILIIVSAFTTSTYAALVDVLSARQSNNTEEAYLNSVCFPNTTTPVPPCQEIINIQTACEPNGTSPLYLEAHAQCMCGGSFFENWIGCLDCNYVHGGRSEQEVDTFNTIVSSASNALCTGTPTASFAAIFSSLTNIGVQGTGATGTSDQFPSNTAISLYFTASGSQGVGAITGSATAATATVTRQITTGGESTFGASQTGGSATGGSASSGRPSTTSTSSGGAAPTGVVLGMMGVIAGGLAIAVL